MRIAIVTAVCGNMEVLGNPIVIHNNADYFAFVDVDGLSAFGNSHRYLRFARFANADRFSRGDLCEKGGVDS